MKDKILVIAAHPDDEVLGMGGTIAKYASKGYEIGLLIVTDGSTSQYKDSPHLNEIIEKKKCETNNCAAILGINQIFYGGLPDMKLDSIPHIEINSVIENVIKEFRPSIVFTHFYGDVNKDHRMVYESTIVACRPVLNQYVKKLFLYSVPSSTEWNELTTSDVFIPNWFEDINGLYAEKKYSGLNCYKTELREYPHTRSVDYLRLADKVEGNKVGLLIAESFILLRNIVLD